MKTKLLTALLVLLLPLSVMAQQVKIQGKVVSATDNEPMIGVAVTVVGSKANAITDLDGNYTINVPAQKGKLHFSYVGCKSVDKAFNGSATINVSLEDDTNMLQEVVAIGYGTMKKSDLTGSVTTVNGDELKKVPASGLDQALQGRAAGVTVNLNSGQPGGAAEVRIRGVGTVNGADPIYVVDGVIVDKIDFLAPSDIVSTEVLKDASSTAIYGSRGANGVILVTTKNGSGQKGHSEINYDGYVGWQQRANTIDLMGRDQFVNTMMGFVGTPKSERNYYIKNGLNAWLNRYQLGRDTHFAIAYDPDKYPNGLDYSSIDTDWQDEVFRTAFMTNHHLSIDGTTDKATYSFSGSYYKQDGTMIGSDYNRYTLRANTSFQVNDWLKIGESATYSYSFGRTALNNNATPNASILSSAIAMAPWDPVRYPEGAVNIKGESVAGKLAAPSNFKNMTHPYSYVDYTHPNDVNERLIADVFAEIKFPLKGLTFRTDVSGDLTIYRNRDVKDRYEVSSYDKNDHSFISVGNNRYTTVIWNNILTYDRQIKDHKFNVMLGQTGEEYNWYGVTGSGKDLANANDPNHWYLNQASAASQKGGDGVTRTRRFSWLGRAFYSYKDRYMITFNFRADGSNKFPQNTWGYFPSLALAWRASEESFLKNYKNLDYLKVRAGWGQIGNDKIGNDAFTQTLGTGTTFVGYVFGMTPVLSDGTSVISYKNMGGRWELTETWNAGIDFSFYKGLISGTLEGFIRNTKDMLLTVKGPAFTGNVVDAQANVGTVSNKGVELTLGHHNKIGQFSYGIDANISYVHNELTNLNGGQKIYSSNGFQLSDEGMPLYAFYGYQYKGVYKTDEEADKALPGYAKEGRSNEYHAGDAIFVDQNGDGKIDLNDKVKIGSPFPNLTYGLNLTAAWKGVDFSMFFQGQSGNKIYNALRMRTEGLGKEATLSTVMVDAWHNIYDADGNITGQEGSIPNPKNSLNFSASSRFLENGAYLRMKTIQLGYTFPQNLIKSIGLQKLRVYVSGSNLFTITNYTGYDPEVYGGVDFGNYPQSRTYLMGLQLTF